MAIKVNPISASPTEVDFSRGQSIEVIQRALNNHNDDGRLRAVSFFLVRNERNAQETKMTTRVTEGPRFSCLRRPALARACTPLTKSELTTPEIP